MSRKKKKKDTRQRNAEVGVTSSAYRAMKAHWELIDTLDGGTLAMREASETYLPKETKEKTDAYESRLSRSVLFNGYRDTSRKISARPFSHPVSLSGNDELSDVLKSIEEDTDGEGTSLTQLGRELFRDALNRGLVHLIVDYPVLNGNETKEQERAAGARPILIPVSASDVIGWRASSVGGRTRLTQVRIRESGEEEDGAYGTATVDRIRVWTETTWEVWRQRESKVDEWMKESEGEHTFGAVPMFTAYFEHTGHMTAVPPLEDLAWLNLAHWQSSSDQRNILRFARTGLWFVKGIHPKDFEKQGGMKLGPSQYVALEAPESDIKVVEHSGSAIEMGANDLRALEEKMEIMGLQPFVRLSGYQTATGTAIHEGRNQTEIQAWVRSIEKLLEEAYWGAAHWIGEDASVDGLSVDIFSDFGIGPRIAADVEALIKARTAREIPRDVFLRELRKRGVLSEDESIEEMEESLAAEGPVLSVMSAGGFGADGEE
jgi:hypothetical protein